jgi:hypothetical protein
MSLHAIYNRDFKLIAMFRKRARAMAFMNERFDLDILMLRKFRHLNEAHLMVMGYAEAVKLEEFAATNTDLDTPLWARGDQTSVAGIQLPARPSFTHDGFTCWWEGCETYNPPAQVYFDSVQSYFHWDETIRDTMDRWGNCNIRCKACEYGSISFRAREHRRLSGGRLYPEISVILNPRDSAREVIEKSTVVMRDAGICASEMSVFLSDLDKVFAFSGETLESVRGVVNDWITVMMISYVELERG